MPETACVDGRAQGHEERGELVGRFSCCGGAIVGEQRWPYDYLVALRSGVAIARDGCGGHAVLSAGNAVVWRAGEAWSIEVLDDAEAITIQSASGQSLDVAAVQRQYEA